MVGRQDAEGRRRQWEDEVFLFVEHNYLPGELDALIFRLVRLSKKWELEDEGGG